MMNSRPCCFCLSRLVRRGGQNCPIPLHWPCTIVLYSKSTVKSFEFSKIKDFGGRYLESHKNRDIGATVWPIFTKFRTDVQNECFNCSNCQKIWILKILLRWRTAAILKTVKWLYIYRSPLPFDRFRWTLKRWCILVLQTWRKLLF